MRTPSERDEPCDTRGMRMSGPWIVLVILAHPAFADDDPKPYPVPVQPDPGDPKPYPVPVNPPDQPKPPDQKPPDQPKPPDPKPPEQAKPPDQPKPPDPTKPPAQKPPSQQQPPVQKIEPTAPTPEEPPPPHETPPPKRDEPPEQISNEPLHGNEKISDIIVKKNTKTTADTVELIARIDVGDEFTADMIERIRHDLVSSGLFSDVDVFWDRLVGK